MGHTRLGVLPATRKWEAIRDLLDGDAAASAIADQTVLGIAGLLGDADKEKRGRLASERGVVLSLWLLMSLPAVAREAADYRAGLEHLGFSLPEDAWSSSIGFVAATTRELERLISGPSTTFTTIAITALRETLTSRLGQSAGSLFETSEEDIRRTWAAYGTTTRFGELAHEYLGSFLERLTQFYLSKETPRHLGSQRFKSLRDLDAFDRELKVWSRERAAIARRFASQWLSKEKYERGRPSTDDAGRFAAYALAKVGSEVRAHAPKQ